MWLMKILFVFAVSLLASNSFSDDDCEYQDTPDYWRSKDPPITHRYDDYQDSYDSKDKHYRVEVYRNDDGTWTARQVYD